MPSDKNTGGQFPGKTSQVLAPVRLVMRALVCAVVPEAAAMNERSWTELEATVDVALHDRPAALHRHLRWAFRFVQWLPLLRYGRTFTSLSSAQRERFLHSLQESRFELVRVGFWGLRTLALLGYYGRPEAARAIGYTPDRRGWEARR